MLQRTKEEEVVSDKCCTICLKKNLIKLPNEFQIYSRAKNFESFFCCNCVQLVNFVLTIDTKQK